MPAVKPEEWKALAAKQDVRIKALEIALASMLNLPGSKRLGTSQLRQILDGEWYPS